jgi:hypothetical protein
VHETMAWALSRVSRLSADRVHWEGDGYAIGTARPRQAGGVLANSRARELNDSKVPRATDTHEPKPGSPIATADHKPPTLPPAQPGKAHPPRHDPPAGRENPGQHNTIMDAPAFRADANA